MSGERTNLITPNGVDAALPENNLSETGGRSRATTGSYKGIKNPTGQEEKTARAEDKNK